MSKKIFAAGYFGYGNFGDELILEIFTHRLKPMRVSHVPRMKTKPLAIIRAIAASGAVVFPGGSVFQDESSSLSLFFYISVMTAARLLGRPVFILDSGFELKRPFSRVILRRALKLASFISVRDSASFQLLRSWGLKPFQSADCAFSLANLRCRKLSPPKTIGVIPRGVSAGIQKAMEECLQKWPGAEFKFAIMSPKDIPSARRLSGDKEPLLIANKAQAGDFFESCDFFILVPYHSLVLAVLAGADFKALTYSAKTVNFLRDRAEMGDRQDVSERIAEECAFQIFVNLLKDKLIS